jgi:hypothetical protein
MSQVLLQVDHLKVMIDQFLVVQVEMEVEEEVEFLLLHLFKNKNHHHRLIDNDAGHLKYRNPAYLIYHNPVLNDLVILWLFQIFIM